MENKCFIIFLLIFLLIIFFTQFKLVNRPIIDNDEGIYLTSFLLVDRGYPAYKKTYFSQPPGYLLSVYPGFMLFGKTIQAARLTVGFWSLIGLVAILWISVELKNKWAGLLAMSILFLIPSYSNQVFTFQSDILITTFSLLSLVTLIKFRKYDKLHWFIISTLFFNFAFWTKFDITFLPSFILILLLLIKKENISIKNIINLFLIFFMVSFGFFLLFILPFGLKEIFNNSIALRFQAATTSSSSFLLFTYLKKDSVLSLIISGTLILYLLNLRKADYLLTIIFFWNIFVFVLLIFYRPLFPHHLVILTVPIVLLFSQLADKSFSRKTIFIYLVIIVLIISLSNRMYITFKSYSKFINGQQQNAVEIIKKYTDMNDFVVCDEEILNGLSGRLPPPELSDISQVRIKSNNLTPESFIQVINDYKPKLIIPWNGRLQSIKNFSRVLDDYKILSTISDSKKIYIRIEK